MRMNRPIDENLIKDMSREDLIKAINVLRKYVKFETDFTQGPSYEDVPDLVGEIFLIDTENNYCRFYKSRIYCEEDIVILEKILA